MRLILPKEWWDAQDVYAPYLIFDKEAKMFVLKEDMPQEIRELYKKNHEELEKMTREASW